MVILLTATPPGAIAVGLMIYWVLALAVLLAVFTCIDVTGCIAIYKWLRRITPSLGIGYEILTLFRNRDVIAFQFF